MITPELNPCPLCGSPVSVSELSIGRDYPDGIRELSARIDCSCGLSFCHTWYQQTVKYEIVFLTHSVDIVTAWNRRATLESTTSQVSKALCGKENATAEEIVAAFSQVNRERDELETERHQLLTRNKQLERERDAAVADLTELAKNDSKSHCEYCKRFDDDYCSVCYSANNEGFEWRGVKEE